jgi:hypothetical protein
MSGNDSTTHEGDSIRDRLTWFGRAATLGGWGLLAVAIVLARSLTVKVGQAYCGTGSAIVLSGAFLVHTFSQAAAVGLLIAASLAPMSASTLPHKLWLTVASLSLALCVGLISLVAWLR